MNNEAICSWPGLEINKVIWAGKWIRMFLALETSPITHRLTAMFGHVLSNVVNNRRAQSVRLICRLGLGVRSIDVKT